MNDAPPPLFPASSQPQPGYPAYRAPSAYPPPKKSSCCGLPGIGCGFGCLLVVILGVVGLIFLGVAGKKWVDARIEEYTSFEGQPLEAPQASPDRIAEALAKAEAFRKGMEPGGTPVPLEVTGEELNLILWNDPEFAQFAGKVEVGIEDDVLSSKFSVAFDQLPLPQGYWADKLKGKHLNGEADVKLGMTAGQPSLYLEGLSLNGMAIPEVFLSELRTQNLLEELAKNPNATAAFDQLEDIRVEGGRLIIVPKAAP